MAIKYFFRERQGLGGIVFGQRFDIFQQVLQPAGMAVACVIVDKTFLGDEPIELSLQCTGELILPFFFRFGRYRIRKFIEMLVNDFIHITMAPMKVVDDGHQCRGRQVF